LTGLTEKATSLAVRVNQVIVVPLFAGAPTQIIDPRRTLARNAGAIVHTGSAFVETRFAKN
jgi:hypothetical protein